MRNGPKSTRINIRLPQDYLDEIEEMAEEEDYQSKSEVVRESMREFYPLLGNVPLIRTEENKDHITFRYKRESEIDRFVSDAEESNFANPQDAVRTAVGYFTGQVDYDFNGIQKAIDSYQGDLDGVYWNSHDMPIKED